MRNRGRRDRLAASQPSLEASRLPVALLDEVPVAVVTFARDGVRFANAAAHRLGIVRGTFLLVAELRQAARLVRRDGVRRQLTLQLPSNDLTATRVPARAEVFLVGGDEVGAVIEDLTEAARVEALRRDFVANVGHEVKTPVGAISVLAEALKEAAGDPAAVARFVERIGVETERLSRLVQELLDLSRLQGGEPLPQMQPVRVENLVGDVVQRLQPTAAAKQVTIAVSGQFEREVVGDAGQLAIALANVVDNAVNYSAPGDTVSVVVKDLEGVVEIAVTDNGIGIAAADLPRIFERFYRVDPARSRGTGGSGLGLAIVKAVMNNHGGEVTVRSTVGSGSTFTLRLPAAAEPAEALVP